MHCRIIYAIKNPSLVPKTPSIHLFGLLRAIYSSVNINALRAQLLLGLIDLLHHHNNPSATKFPQTSRTQALCRWQSKQRTVTSS